MKKTSKIRLACKTIALAALLADAVPIVAMASPSTFGNGRMAAKPFPLIFGALPVAAPRSTTGMAAPAAKAAPSTSGAEVAVVAKASPSLTSDAVAAAPRKWRSTAHGEGVTSMALPSVCFVPVGESRVFRLARPISRVAVGDSEVADYIMINSSQLYLLGKKTGATNLVLWDRAGNITTTPLHVSRNISNIREILKAVLPNETGIQLYASGPALIVAGSVSDALAAETAMRIVKAHAGGTVPDETPETTLVDSVPASGYAAQANLSGVIKSTAVGTTGTSNASSSGIPGVVNLLKIRNPQQVRLEVRIAEVSRSYIEALGIGLMKDTGGTQGSLMTGFVSDATLHLILNASYDPIKKTTIGKQLGVEAERKKSLVKILAEPTIVAMSGHEGFFLVGGKIYTPTIGAFGQIDYVERTYGVGLRCTPTVLDEGRISLRVAPEVSEPLKEAITAGTNINLPAFKMSYASTTVQMNEGENLVIGGLLRDNITEIIRAVPLLGDIPVLGTLFRRTEKEAETTELMVIIRPTLVKASATAPELPTDKFVPAGTNELFIGGKHESSRR